MMKKTKLPIVKNGTLEVYIKKPFFQDINIFAHQVDFEIKKQFSFLEDRNEKYLDYYLDVDGKGIWLCFVLRDFKRDTKPYLK